jgi:PKD repeat protein
VRDSSGQVGNGAVAPFAVTLRRPPTAAAAAAKLTAPDVPLPFDASGSVAGDRPIAHYEWDFQDGTKADGAKVTHAFSRSGRYVVTLRVRDDQPGPCDSSVTQTIVDVNAPPVAVAGADQHAAVGETVKLDGRGSYDIDGEIVDWAWDLGDGTTAKGPTISHAYDHPGTYTTPLTVSDGAGLANRTAASTARVIVNAPPVAMPGPERHVAVGESITCDGGASIERDGKLVRSDWTFGDGSSGNGARVPYAYSKPGRYLATLTVVDDSGTSSSASSASALIVVNAPPTAKAGPDQLVTSSEVSFDGTGSSDPDGTIASYAWDFGDGTTGSGPKPSHVYRKAGSYLVHLTVSDDSGTIRSSARDTMHVLINQAPVADAGPDQLAAPGQELTFDGSASQDPDGDIAAWSWSFGDGTSADGQRVRHAYARSGIYQVQLTVHDNTGQPNAIGFDQAKVTVNAPPVAKAGPDVLAAPGDEVTLDGSGSFDEDGKITGWRWDFSDRSLPAEGRAVTRTYDKAGVYTARLTVTDDSGAINGVAQDEVAIRINHRPVADAGKDITSSSTVIAFDASASADADGDALVYSWDFGDGSPPGAGVRTTHAYAEGGTYPVVLTVDDGTGLANARSTAALTVLIDRPPVAVAGGNRETCGGSVVVFDGSKSHDPEGGLLRYHWDFGDGTGSDIVNPTKTYVHGGAYPVTLTVEDDSGFAANRDTDRILVRVHDSPIAAAGPDQLVCAGGEVHFDGSASRNPGGVISRYSWNFGDGTNGSSDRPVHVFTKPGDYRVVLTIEGDQAGQCANTNSGEMSVKVIEAPIARMAAPAAVPVGAAAHFDAAPSSVTAGRITGWHWDFGDGQSAEGAAVDHTFAKAGRYVVVLALDTAGGVATCSRVTTQHAIVVNASPVAVAGGDRTVGTGEEVMFDASASHDADGGIVDYQWDFADGTKASGVNVRHRFATAGRYAVKLTVTDNTNLPNNQGSDVAMVTVDQPPEAMITRPPAACPAETLAFSGAGSHDPGGSIKSYAWSFGDGAKAEGVNVTHSYAAPGLYELALTVDDGSGLAGARQQTAVPFRVNRAPRALAGPDRLACPDQDVAFDGSASADWDGRIAEYRWDFGDGSTAQGVRATHRFASPGSYDVRLTVTDDSGSSCATATSLARVTVIAAPVAQAGGDLTGYIGGAHDELLFDASGSKAKDGRPLAYEWDLGDGTVLAGERVRHAYAKPGQYPVRLTVSDDSGLACGKAADSIEVRVDSRQQ